MLPDRIAAAVRGAQQPVCAYVYDTAALVARAAEVRAALPPGTTLLYAMKANGHPDVVRALAGAADGIEVASGGELAVAVAAGARRIAFGGPAKTDAELAAAVAAGATVHVESVGELRRLAHVGGRAARVALRVNRAGVAVTGSHQMTGVPTPFGIDEAQLADVVATARELGIAPVGFHLHAVSNSLDAAEFADHVNGAVSWSLAAGQALGIPVEYVNAGGGLGVSYTGPQRLDLTALAAALDPVPQGIELAVEPGRYLAADAGWYAAEVLDLKHTHGRWFAVVRGGTHHLRLPAAWGYDHPFTVLPVERWPYPWDRPEVTGEVDAVGELCTPRDVLCRGQAVDRLRVGDVLVFARVGAYGWDISHHEYLRHPHPELIVLPLTAGD
ncbi:diaminopimelate decarboxylase [Allocatelliglobosispora scoriae]|uniref:Diaminopimelate decarboxylase n=1 Tax=Allocatelliglobosispora scoriae TaxID=643052 RepID=A0A841BCX3_9ACTN|nr:alanine racemase [Allocatelliglobosispora scoriae]MBB5866957.1 diaminopimelate decarboxylase [Allocatelliglobosispora scoriae]